MLSKNHSYVNGPEPSLVSAVKVLMDPSFRIANGGVTSTVGSLFTDTVTAFDAMVLGLLALSVVFKIKLHLPVSVVPVVTKTWVSKVAPLIMEYDASLGGFAVPLVSVWGSTAGGFGCG